MKIPRRTDLHDKTPNVFLSYPCVVAGIVAHPAAEERVHAATRAFFEDLVHLELIFFNRSVCASRDDALIAEPNPLIEFR